MARTKFNTIRIEYAGADLVSGGMLADVGGALNGSTRYTTQAVAHLGAGAVDIDESGNLEREISVSVAVDYGAEADMVAGILERQDFADSHQRGVLKCTVGGSGKNARASVELKLDWGVYPMLAIFEGTPDEYGGEVVYTVWDEQLTADNVGEWVAWLNSGAAGTLEDKARASYADGVLTLEMLGGYAGAAGNGCFVSQEAGSPYEGNHRFTGGEDDLERAYSAGLAGFEYSSTLGGGGLRVVFTYAFTAGGDADAGA